MPTLPLTPSHRGPRCLTYSLESVSPRTTSALTPLSNTTVVLQNTKRDAPIASRQPDPKNRTQMVLELVRSTCTSKNAPHIYTDGSCDHDYTHTDVGSHMRSPQGEITRLPSQQKPSEFRTAESTRHGEVLKREKKICNKIGPPSLGLPFLRAHSDAVEWFTRGGSLPCSLNTHVCKL